MFRHGFGSVRKAAVVGVAFGLLAALVVGAISVNEAAGYPPPTDTKTMPTKIDMKTMPTKIDPKAPAGEKAKVNPLAKVTSRPTKASRIRPTTPNTTGSLQWDFNSIVFGGSVPVGGNVHLLALGNPDFGASSRRGHAKTTAT